MDLASGREPGDPIIETICEATLELDCDNPRAKKALGRIRAEQGRTNEAKVLFQHAGEHLDLSVLLAAERNYTLAAETAAKAMGENPVGAHSQLDLDCDNRRAKKSLGRIRAEQGRTNEAKVLFCSNS